MPLVSDKIASMSRLSSNILRKLRQQPRVTHAPLSAANYRRGTAEWLVATERELGGLITGVRRRSVSPFDPRSEAELKSGGMTGGDRMGDHHHYAVHYAKYLRRFLEHRSPTVVECGILNGSGLALWSKLFPNAQLFGLDIDPSHFEQNLGNLLRLGAFEHSQPHISRFDQFDPDTSGLEQALKGQSIDIFIDDGFHSNEAITGTFAAVSPLLSPDFVYFAEDNDRVAKWLRELAGKSKVARHGQLTVVEGWS